MTEHYQFPNLGINYYKAKDEQEFMELYLSRREDNSQLEVKIGGYAKRGIKSFQDYYCGLPTIFYLEKKDEHKLYPIESPTDLAVRNMYVGVYDFDINDLYSFEGNTFDLRECNQKLIQDIIEDYETLNKIESYHLQDSSSLIPIIGNALQMPDGKFVYFCKIWNDHAQTTPAGSFHIDLNQSKDSIISSYSGGLDHGIKLDDIIQTNEETLLPIWFCHKGILKANNGVYATIKTRVWKTKPGADLSGIKTEY